MQKHEQTQINRQSSGSSKEATAESKAAGVAVVEDKLLWAHNAVLKYDAPLHPA